MSSKMFENIRALVAKPYSSNDEEVLKNVIFDTKVASLLTPEFLNTLQRLSKLFDFDGDGNFTTNDFKYIKERINLGFVLNLYIYTTCIIMKHPVFNKSTLSSEKTFDFALKLVLYAILRPLVLNEQTRLSLNEKLDPNAFPNMTSGEYLITFILEPIYEIGKSNEFLQTQLGNLFNLLKKSFSCCSCMQTAEDENKEANTHLELSEQNIEAHINSIKLSKQQDASK
jgi:hypothetical protein